VTASFEGGTIQSKRRGDARLASQLSGDEQPLVAPHLGNEISRAAERPCRYSAARGVSRDGVDAQGPQPIDHARTLIAADFALGSIETLQPDLTARTMTTRSG